MFDDFGRKLQIDDPDRGTRAYRYNPLGEVERQLDAPSGVNEHSVPAEAFGDFLCSIFDEWKDRDMRNNPIRRGESTM